MVRKVRESDKGAGGRPAAAKAAAGAAAPATGRKRVPAKPSAKRSPKHSAARPNRPAPEAATGGDSAPAQATTGAKALIRAGLKALGEVRGDMVARQTRVFELLLGIGQSPAWTAGPASDRPRSLVDPFGKFEEVFDQRVARSLERLGMPSPQVLQALAEQVKLLAEPAAEPPEPRKRPRR